MCRGQKKENDMGKWFKIINIFGKGKNVNDDVQTLGFAFEGVVKALIYKKAGDHKTAKYMLRSASEVFGAVKGRETFLPIRDRISEFTDELREFIEKEDVQE
jgi:hemerythrin-like domain-containing protein